MLETHKSSNSLIFVYETKPLLCIVEGGEILHNKPALKIVSACLAGVQCRYDHQHNSADPIRELVVRGEAVPVCPEQLGGLSTPRLPAEIVGGD